MKRAFLILGLALSLACTDKSPTGPKGVAALSASEKEPAGATRLPRRAPRVVGPRTNLGPPVIDTIWGDPTTHQSGNVGTTGAHEITSETVRPRASDSAVKPADIR